MTTNAAQGRSGKIALGAVGSNGIGFTRASKQQAVSGLVLELVSHVIFFGIPVA